MFGLEVLLPMLMAAWPTAPLTLFSGYLFWRLVSLEKEVRAYRSEHIALERKFARVCNAYVYSRALLLQLLQSIRQGKKPDLEAAERAPSLIALLRDDNAPWPTT